MDVLGKFRYSRFTPEMQRLVTQGLEELKALTGRKYGVWRMWWGRILARIHPKFTLVQIANNTRPPGITMMVLLEAEKRVLLPHARVQDFFAFASLLGVHSLQGYATLYAFLLLSYSVYHKQHPPEQICNAEDARSRGFTLPEEYLQYTTGQNSLWWELYGGLLYTLTIDNNHEHPVLQRRCLDWAVGNYKPAKMRTY